MFKILIIDDDPTLRLVLKRTIQNQGYEAILASSGEEGIIQAQRHHPALIICDWMMQEMDGIEVCRRIKSELELSTTFFILLTARKEVEDRVEGLDAGADDFLSKPIDINELKARVRAGLRLHQMNQDLQTQKSCLEALNQKLQAELDEAADYVRSLLPAPLSGSVTTQARFIPSTQLGGDCFDYYWLDDDNLAIYLLDVAGHGVRSALLSISILNLMRSQSLPNTNFYEPSAVLAALNNVCQISETGDDYLTIWYGVYNRIERQLVYASAGHPPAILLSGAATDPHIKRLTTPNIPIGILPQTDFDDSSCVIETDSVLHLFSDGVYEIQQPDGKIWSLDAFIDLLAAYRGHPSSLDEVIQSIRNLSTSDAFDDDLSLLQICFS